MTVPFTVTFGQFPAASALQPADIIPFQRGTTPGAYLSMTVAQLSSYIGGGGGGGGDVVGPANSTDGAFPLYDGTTGKLLKNSAYSPASFATASQGLLAASALQPGSVGSAAYQNVGYFATAAQGSLAATALQPGSVGSAAFQNVGYFATAAQGTKADTAVQPGGAALGVQLQILDMGTHKITNVVDPTGAQDAATKAYVDAHAGGAPGGATTQLQYNNAGAFGGTGNVFYDAANGRIGIGTNAPGVKLEIKGDGYLQYWRGSDDTLLGRLGHDTVTLSMAIGRFIILGNHGTMDSGGIYFDRTQSFYWSQDGADYGTPDTSFSRRTASPGVVVFGNGTPQNNDGKIEVAGVILKAPNASRWLLTVSNAGVLSTTAL